MKNINAQELGKLGGEATTKKYGKKHFSEAGKKGMQKRWNPILPVKCDICSKTYSVSFETCPSCEGKSSIT